MGGYKGYHRLGNLGLVRMQVGQLASGTDALHTRFCPLKKEPMAREKIF